MPTDEPLIELVDADHRDHGIHDRSVPHDCSDFHYPCPAIGPPFVCAECGHPVTAHQSAVDRRDGPCSVCGCRAVDPPFNCTLPVGHGGPCIDEDEDDTDAEWVRPRPPVDPPFVCAIVWCGRPAEWIVLGTDERIGFCRRHRDLIEDEGLDLIDDD